MIKRPNTRAQRMKRHARVRGKISGTAERPRLNVFRSENHIYAQVIDDVAGNTLISASTVEKGFEGYGSNIETDVLDAEGNSLFECGGDRLCMYTCANGWRYVFVAKWRTDGSRPLHQYESFSD